MSLIVEGIQRGKVENLLKSRGVEWKRIVTLSESENGSRVDYVNKDEEDVIASLIDDKLYVWKDIIFKEGDKIYVDDEMIETIRKNNGTTVMMAERFEATEGLLFSERTSRDGGMLCIKWQNGEVSDCAILTESNCGYTQPDFAELKIEECPDRYLSERELVKKYSLAQANSSTEKQCIEFALVKIEEAMKKEGIVFKKEVKT